jgi:hypothetical protein
MIRLLEEEERILNLLHRIEPMQISSIIDDLFHRATHYHLCGLKFEKKHDKVRNHDHITGEFFGAAHRNCNLQFKQVEFIPVILHNLRGFDAHLIMQRLGKFKKKRINVIANTNERHVSFTISKLRFIDSFQFLTTSLDILVKNLKSSGVQHFHQFNESFPSDSCKRLLLKKGIYPYSFITDSSKFLVNELPPKDEFYNTIRKCYISDEEYEQCERSLERDEYPNNR